MDRSVDRSFWRILSLIVCLLFLRGQAQAEQLELNFESAESRRSKAIRSYLLKSRLFHNIVEQINARLSLPQKVLVTFNDGDVGSSYYDPETVEIVLEYGEFAETYDLLREEEELNSKTSLKRMLQIGEFFFYHELGHALVDILELPVVGREEDAVDGLAAYMILEMLEEPEVALAAARQFLLESETYESEDEDEFYDEHSLDRQRFYNIVAWIYGSDPDNHEDTVGQLVPEDWWDDRSEVAIEEYVQLVFSWEVLLQDALSGEKNLQAQGILVDHTSCSGGMCNHP